MDFVCGAGMMIKGFDMAVAAMEVGQEIDVRLEPADAYGEINPAMVLTVTIEELPGSEDLKAGDRIYLNTPGGPIPAAVTFKDDSSITLDANHELAGKPLNFHIELVEVQ